MMPVGTVDVEVPAAIAAVAFLVKVLLVVSHETPVRGEPFIAHRTGNPTWGPRRQRREAQLLGIWAAAVLGHDAPTLADLVEVELRLVT